MSCDLGTLFGVADCSPSFIADPQSIFTHYVEATDTLVEVRTCAAHGLVEAEYITRSGIQNWRAVTVLL